MQLIKLAKHLLHLQVVRYFISAGTATAVDTGTFYVVLYYVLHRTDVTIWGNVIAATTVAFASGSAVGLVTNFLVTKYFVFNKSNIKGHIQFLRYISVAALVILANYALMSQVLLRFVPQYPTIDRAVAAVIIGLMSFTIHRVFSFQIKADAKS